MILCIAGNLIQEPKHITGKGTIAVRLVDQINIQLARRAEIQNRVGNIVAAAVLDHSHGRNSTVYISLVNLHDVLIAAQRGALQEGGNCEAKRVLPALLRVIRHDVDIGMVPVDCNCSGIAGNRGVTRVVGRAMVALIDVRANRVGLAIIQRKISFVNAFVDRVSAAARLFQVCVNREVSRHRSVCRGARRRAGAEICQQRAVIII